MTEFNKTTDILIERLQKMADGKTNVRLYDEMCRTTMDMISNVS
jgi:hypothetical protein